MSRPPVVILLLAAASAPAWAADVDYARDIKPLLSAKCTACHGPLKQEAGLRLDAGSLIHRGSENGPILTPNQSADSRVVERVSAADPADRMPPEGEASPLTAQQVALLKSWIDAGAPFPADEAILEDPRQHWAYRVPRRPAVPDAPNVARSLRERERTSPDSCDWSANPIDAFVSAQHRARGLTPLPAADRATLFRRVYFDLIGLPPTRDELHAFLADASSDAYERVVDRLLEDPRYGERWGRHWMDVWRYSDWDGYGKELRGSQRHLWRWRDWIIESLNADKPYDRMVLEMLAGDEIAPENPDVLRATGYLARNHYRLNRDLWMDNTVEHTFKAFVAVTLNCAKCHDHKYDPLAQQDYYTARAIFEPYKVRIDRLPGQPDVETDGLTRAFDADLAAQTFVYVRGNEKQPDKEHPISPAVPDIFGGALETAAVELPLLASRPDLREFAVEETLAASRRAVSQAVEALGSARTAHATASERLAAVTAASDEPAADPFAGDPVLRDDFSAPRPDLWNTGPGEWAHADGRLVQSKVAQERCELVSKVALPRDFAARVRFRILGGTTYHSVGLSFDVTDAGDSDGVYLSAHPPGPKVQVVHQRDGRSDYPEAGRRAQAIELNREYRLDVLVRDRLLNVCIDGAPVLACRLPRERRNGWFSVWAFDTRAEFLAARVVPLAPSIPLVENIGATAPNTVDEARLAVNGAQSAVTLAERNLAVAQSAAASTAARLAADRAKLSLPPDPASDALALAAAKAEREHVALAAEVAVVDSESKHAAAQRAAKPDDKKTQDALTKTEKDLAEARKKLDEARAALDKTDSAYTPFGTEYPRTSTGRRLALARWIASRENPLTARVAVNHLWLRHFGTPLVDNVFDFGLRTPPPVHHDLLDWLAVEFMDGGWRMKRVHRMIVTSQTYRLASGEQRVQSRDSNVSGESFALPPVAAKHEDGAASALDPRLSTLNSAIDPDNRFYWRSAPRRLDAEAVRDSLLALAGSLDATFGGPDIDFADGEKILRRSVYFRHAYEKQMRFLTLFDAASPTECYRRSESIIPQQALALSNSALALAQARKLARALCDDDDPRHAGDDAFSTAAFEQVLIRPPTEAESATCREFLTQQRAALSGVRSLTAFEGGATVDIPPSDDPTLRARENLVHVLLNHNDFVTVR